jgi:hypothetical protein
MGKGTLPRAGADGGQLPKYNTQQNKKQAKKIKKVWLKGCKAERVCYTVFINFGKGRKNDKRLHIHQNRERA